MKCPKCETENQNRNVCQKCGMFLYDGRSRNRVRLSPEEKKKILIRNIKQTIWLSVKFFLVLLGFLILSIVVIFLLTYFTS